jgi:hypothetical protein
VILSGPSFQIPHIAPS